MVAAIRVDKLPELVHSFVSDHIGYKFVEPVQFDLGRVFSECEPSQPIVYTVRGPNEATSDIKKFAEERERPLVQLSMGSVDHVIPHFISFFIIKKLSQIFGLRILTRGISSCPTWTQAKNGFF